MSWLTKMALFGLAATTGTVSSVRADEIADFYKGKQISFIIGYSVSGGYNAYARLIARYLGRHIPGNPNIVPQNMPGAGSRSAANWLFNIGAKDGTVIGTVGQNTPMDQALNEKNIRFDVARFNWIGNPVIDNNVTLSWAGSGFDTLDDVRKGGLICGGTGATAPTAVYPQILNNLLGLKIKIIASYPGGGDVGLAMQRGEVNCRGSNSWSSQKATGADQIRDRKIVVLVEWGLKSDPAIAAYHGGKVPLIIDLAKTENDRKALELIVAGASIGRPILMPPDVPPARVAALRQAFDATMKDPAFLEAAAKAVMDIDPVSGPVLQKLASDVVGLPEHVIRRARELVEPRDIRE